MATRKSTSGLRRNDKYDIAADRIVFDDHGPFRKALKDEDPDDAKLAEALAAELRVLERTLAESDL